MTILHVEKTVADNTIWFDHPLPRCTHISLISYNFVNKMMNLNSEGTISDAEGSVLLRIPKGNYSNITKIKNVIDKVVYIGKKPVSIDGNYLIPIINIILNDSLAELLNLSTNLEAKSRNVIKISGTPNAVYLHCDIIDSNKVMLNNKYSQVLAYIPINDNIVSYNPERVYIPINHDYINSIRFWITDKDNELIKDRLYPMHLVLELI